MLFDSNFVALPSNWQGRDFVVGDVHGQIEMLRAALDVVRFDPHSDRLFGLGDLIDRGSGSLELLRMLDSQAWFYSIVGNHEAMMLRAQQDWEVRRAWDGNDNDWAEQLEPGQLQECCRIAEGMPLAIEIPLRDGRRIGLIHAEVRVGRAWDDMRTIGLHGYDAINHAGTTDSAAAIWGRRRVTAEALMRYNRSAKGIDPDRLHRTWDAAQPVAGIDLVIAGHTVLQPALPRAISNLLYIDTGAYRDDGRLTIVAPLERVYWQIGRTQMGLRALRRQATPLPQALVLPDAYRPNRFSCEADPS